MRHGAVLLTFLVAVGVALAQGQSRPDFSGVWRLSLDRSRLDERIAAGLERGTAQIAQNATRFSFNRVFVVRGQESRSSYDLLTDGAEATVTDGALTRRSRLAWDGDELVLRERVSAPQGEATNTVHYRLLDGGRTLEARETFRGPKLQYDNVWVFERQPAGALSATTATK